MNITIQKISLNSQSYVLLIIGLFDSMNKINNHLIISIVSSVIVFSLEQIILIHIVHQCASSLISPLHLFDDFNMLLNGDFFLLVIFNLMNWGDSGNEGKIRFLLNHGIVKFVIYFIFYDVLVVWSYLFSYWEFVKLKMVLMITFKY